MFESTTANRDPSPPTTLTPGPDHQNVFRPDLHRDVPPSLEKACEVAQSLGRPYLIWMGRIYVVAGKHQALATDLGYDDIKRGAAIVDE